MHGILLRLASKMARSKREAAFVSPRTHSPGGTPTCSSVDEGRVPLRPRLQTWSFMERWQAHRESKDGSGGSMRGSWLACRACEWLLMRVLDRAMEGGVSATLGYVFLFNLVSQRQVYWESKSGRVLILCEPDAL